ncbi:GGDEF domain-containing protein [Tatumella saanichensis]|uniref:GGDEF domain-containing protein n=1 Tax=Tatumella saanichensis TaxID=480813 RepID=UPI0004A3DA5F|nr:GGDEF domain-containing protein [Tatumella saanichensis]
MKFKQDHLLIGFQGTPDRKLYWSFIGYALLTLCVAAWLAINSHNLSNLRPYFYIVFCTAIMIAWFLAKSFHTQPYEKYVTFFRVGLFILFNCQLAVLAAGLELLAINLVALIVSVLFVPAMALVILAFNDFISFINYNYKSAVDLSLTDELTGLPNRRALNFILREMEKKAATVCIIDIDYFKRINDTFGHETGDKVLTTIGLTLNRFIDQELLVSRSGGEEFCIIMSENVDVAGKVREIVDALTMDYNQDISITVSAGVAVKRRTDNFTLAMIAADEALYRAKSEGRNQVVSAESGRLKRHK